MEELIINIVKLVSFLGMFTYGVVFLAAFMETTLGLGLIIPGSTIILIFGAIATNESFSVWLIIPIAALGAILGDNLNYYLGRKYGKKWVNKDSWILTPTNYEKGREFFDNHGAKSIFFGRFIPAIKEIIPFIAGIAHMNKKRFYFYNVIGAIGWSVQWVGIGYFFGYSITAAQTWIHKVQLAFAFIILGVIIYYVAGKMLSDKK